MTANAGYRVVSVLMDGQPTTAPYAFNNVIANGHTISATFELTIPENFPPWIILTLLGTGTLAVIIGFKRKPEN